MQAEQERASQQSQRPRAILTATCVVVWALIGWHVTRLQPLVIAERTPAIHFVEYWAAGRLQLTGNNPYSPEQLFALQQSVGLTRDRPEIMWNPPWTLSFVMPFGMLSYPISRLLWLMLHLALVLFCADWTWRFYGGPIRRYWIAWIVGFTFLPTLNVLLSEQIGPLILLGLVGFLHFEKRKQWWLAGSVLVLIAIKPHLLYLFWIALIFWALDRKRWAVLLGGAVSGLVATTIPLIFNPAVISQYFYLCTTAKPTPFDWATPTLGSFLRLLFGLEKVWLQFVPSLLGILWFLLYWHEHRRTWEWAEQLPPLLLVSVSTTSFGWTFDQVVLLPAVIQAAVWTFHSHQPLTISLAMATYLTIDSVALTMNILRINDLWHFWMAPALLLTYLTLRSQINQETSSI